MLTQFAKVTDYFDSRASAIDHMATELESLPDDDRRAALAEIKSAVNEHIRVLPDDLLVASAITVSDDVYKSGCWLNRMDGHLAAYLEASAGAYWSAFSARGFTCHYLVDNAFDDLARPLRLFRDWFGFAGFTYACPQAVAAELIRASEGEEAPVTPQRIATYTEEARHVTESILDRCRAESRHFVLLDLDFDERTFRSSMAARDQQGLLTVFRNEATDPGTKVAAWLPIQLRG